MFTGLSAPTASATSYSSIYGTYGPILGYNYKNQATASNSPYQGIGSAFNNDNPVRSEPAGYFGAQGILYRNGAICRSTQLSYSQFVTSAWNAYTPSGSCGSGVYNAKGSTAAYNGNGYSTYFTPVSPNFNG